MFSEYIRRGLAALLGIASMADSAAVLATGEVVIGTYGRKIWISTSPDPSSLGQTVTVHVSGCTYRIPEEPWLPVSTDCSGSLDQSVSVYDDSQNGALVCSLNLTHPTTVPPATYSSGRCSLASLTPGSHSLRAQLDQHSEHGGTTHTVLFPVDLSWVMPTSAVYGETVTFTANVRSGQDRLSTGTVQVYEVRNGSEYSVCSDTPYQGVATCTDQMAELGNKVYRARYSGTTIYDKAVSSDVSLTVTQAKTSTSLSKQSPGSSDFDSAIGFSVGVSLLPPGAEIGWKSLSDGKITVTGSDDSSCTANLYSHSSSCNLYPNHSGDITYTAHYSGTPYYAPSDSVAIVHRVLAVLGVAVSGHGSVAGSIPTACGDPNTGAGRSCRYTFNDSDVVVLSATPSGGDVFFGWGGVCSGTGPSCSITMRDAKNVTASFGTINALTVTKSGSGTITSSPAGIDCGSTCSNSFRSNQSVTLTATAAAGFRFTGWSGACSGSASSCQVSMDQARSVGATFSPLYTLSVTNVGSGSVVSSPAGIDCGVNCSYGFPSGQVVTLTPVRKPGYRFNGWSGACTGNARTCVVTMNQAASVSATFIPAAVKNDLDGDRKSDLFWFKAANGQTNGWLMDGLAWKSTGILLVNPEWRAMATGDFNGDGKADILWTDVRTGTTRLMLMNGLTATSNTVVQTSPNWAPVFTADLNGDGRPDIVWRNSVTGEVSVWFMDGTTQLNTRTILTNLAWMPIAAGDLNGDSRDDIVWYKSSTGETAVWLMDGGMIPGGGATLMVNPDWVPVAAGDLDGDGKADIVFYNSKLGATEVWFMNGTAKKSNGRLMTNLSYRPVVAADLDGDGKSDILFRKPINGDNLGALVDTLTIKSSKSLGASLDWVPLAW